MPHVVILTAEHSTLRFLWPVQVEFAECNHWLYMEDPERFNDLVVHFAHRLYSNASNFTGGGDLILKRNLSDASLMVNGASDPIGM